MWEEILKNPFAFYMHVEENMAKNRDLNMLDVKNKNKFVAASSACSNSR